MCYTDAMNLDNPTDIEPRYADVILRRAEAEGLTVEQL